MPKFVWFEEDINVKLETERKQKQEAFCRVTQLALKLDGFEVTGFNYVKMLRNCGDDSEKLRELTYWFTKWQRYSERVLLLEELMTM